MEFVQGKGTHKPEIQKLYEEPEECGKRLMGYKDCFEITGKDRNSYSKTDLDYFIVHGYVSNDCTDYNTLIPVLEKHRKAFGEDCSGSRKAKKLRLAGRHGEVLQHEV